MAEDPPSALRAERARARLLLFSVLVVATCGLVYELISATLASYLLGDSVTQFSLVIGVYLSAMGVGSWLSKSVVKSLPDRFVVVQLIIAVVGGSSASALFYGFAVLDNVRPLLFGILVTVGVLVGLEIPLLMRLMPKREQLKDLVARVLAFDYIGALAASLLFPLLLLPHLGLVRTSLLFGLLNALVALWTTRAFRAELRRPRLLQVQAATIAAALATALAFGGRIETHGERNLYEAPVVFSTKTPYQRIVLTRWAADLRLYIDGNLQFSSLDEHRYHEALVHPALASVPRPARVLILGGGDGLALREVLEYPEVESVDLVDLDPAMPELFSSNPALTEINLNAFADARVQVHSTDAMKFLEAHLDAGGVPYDAVLVDLPDPNGFALGKLYSRSFYRLLRANMAERGVGVVQATSPYYAPRAYWCVVRTLEDASLHPRPYHAHVPSFGDWGFVLVQPASRAEENAITLRPELDYGFLNDEVLESLFVFPADQPRLDVEVNRLDNQLLVHYYERDLSSPTPGARP